MAIIDITVHRITRKNTDERMAALSGQVNQMLLSAVVMEPPVEKHRNLAKTVFDTRPFYKLGISGREVKKVLVNEMLGYRNYFSGQIADRIRKLYLDLSLHKDAISRLYKKNWETKVNALAELFKMDIEVDHPYLLQLIHDKNRYIREFARLSLIKFTKGDPLQFLHELDEPISHWEEFEIFLVFQQKTNYTLGSLEGLIALDKEPTIVSLCLKLASYFKQHTCVNLVLNLLKTPNLKLRAEAIATLGKLGGRNAEHYLVAMYPEQPHEIKLEILKALGMVHSGQYLDFLENEFVSSTDFEIKKYASDAIIKLHPLSDKTIEKLLGNSEALTQKILHHSLDPLINAL